MTDHPPIGDEIDTLCEATEIITRLQQADPAFIQRRVYVGWARANRLLGLLTSYGVTGEPDPKGRRPVLVAWRDRAGVIARLREIAGKETEDA